MDQGGTETRTIIRRRGGREISRTTHDSDGSFNTKVVLDGGAKGLTVAERVREAAERMTMSLEGKRAVRSTITQRGDQATVFTDFALFLNEAAAHLADNLDIPFAFARIVQPPRTGKTIIMGEIISGTGASALVLVPKVNLVNQTADSLRKQLPDISIGVYHGGEKQLVRGGVIVATYQIFKKRFSEGQLPREIREATLVFWDEGHHAMTENCVDLRANGFEVGTLHVAFTATPDYNERKTLAAFFPHLVHEITLAEAFELKLFADLNVKVVSVHADGRQIEIVGQDFDQKTLGKVMSAEAFLEATSLIRYEVGNNTSMPALICCVDKAQARAMQTFLSARRPNGRPEPALVLDDTKDRETILEDFEAGRIDTIINVAVLLEGWNSPRCKLEIDLAPSLSEVRAKQKYFRVMTKDGGAKAMIYVLVPESLSRVPIFPQSLFGQSVEVEGFEDWMSTQPNVRRKKTDDSGQKSAVKVLGVKAFTQVLYSFDSTQVRLDPKNLDNVRTVFETQFTVTVEGRLPKLSAFLMAWFETPLFIGYGAHLLRYCGHPLKKKYFRRFLTRLYPEVMADRILRKDNFDWYEDFNYQPEQNRHPFDYFFKGEEVLGEQAFFLPSGTGPYVDPDYDLEEHVDQIISVKRVLNEIEGNGRLLTERQRFVLSRFFSQSEATFAEIGDELGLSRNRVHQIYREAVWKLSTELLAGRL